MITVRYPNGQTLRYKAGFLHHGDNKTWILREKKDGDPIAFIQASAGAIVEFADARSVSNPLNNNIQTERDIRSIKRELNSLRKIISSFPQRKA